MSACPNKVINFLSAKGQSHVLHLPASVEDSLRLTGWGWGRDPTTGDKDTAGRPAAVVCVLVSVQQGALQKEEKPLWFVAFANFHSVNSPTVTDFRLAVQCHYAVVAQFYIAMPIHR